MLVITKPDRLARSVKDLLNIVESLKKKNVGLKVLSMGLDTTGPEGKLMLTVLGAVAEFERDIMLTRQREGIAKAKALGRYKGRKPTARAIGRAGNEEGADSKGAGCRGEVGL